ncbi:MAG: hypothetical protein HUK03_04140 [Bacteroidaceae bacterium]|nr:hypothetical protein [Bacteroidaceae bacterium]
MRKQYIQPRVDVFHAVEEPMIATSIGIGGDKGNIDAEMKEDKGSWNIWG